VIFELMPFSNGNFADSLSLSLSLACVRWRGGVVCQYVG
jgi:hypothetical protein